MNTITGDEPASAASTGIINNKRQHWFIACAEITFVHGDGENTGITRLNSMMKSDKQAVGVEMLGRAQQAAQLQLLKNLNDPGINVLNVVFVSICYLGHMTEKEFYKTNSQQAAAQTSAQVVDLNGIR